MGAGQTLTTLERRTMKRILLSLALALLLASPAGAEITFVDKSEAEAEAGSGNIILDFPDTVANGDVAIACVYSRDNVTHTLTDWTQIAQGNGSGTSSRISAWYLRYAGSAPNLVVGHAAGDSIVGGVVIFRGVKASGSPIDATGTGSVSGGTGDTTIEHASITPTTSNTMLIACNGATDNQARNPIPTDFTCAWPTEFESACSITTSLGSDASVALHWKTHSSGATGTIVDTHTGSTTVGWGSVLFSLEAAATSARRRTAPIIFP
jgi:hypothetical protein